jgi:hypothetical protein
MSGEQSELYKNVDSVDYLGDLVGADRAADLIRISITDSDHTPSVDVIDRDGRNLGTVTIDEIPEPITTKIAEALVSNGNDSIRVVSAEALDVSGATVPTDEQTPNRLENTSGTEIDPATESTLVSLIQALASNGGDSLLVDSNEVLQVNDKSRYHEHRVESRTIDQGEIYIVKAGEEWNVNNLTVNGQLEVEGTLSYYGTIDGNGTIKGPGVVRSKD